MAVLQGLGASAIMAPAVSNPGFAHCSPTGGHWIGFPQTMGDVLEFPDSAQSLYSSIS